MQIINNVVPMLTLLQDPTFLRRRIHRQAAATGLLLSETIPCFKFKIPVNPRPRARDSTSFIFRLRSSTSLAKSASLSFNAYRKIRGPK